MCNFRKIVKILGLVNVFLLIGMYLLCFTNQPDSIPGVCDECAAGTSITFTFATMVLIILAVIAVVICCNTWNTKKKSNFLLLIILAAVSVLFAMLERAIFSGNPSVGAHEELSQKALRLIDLLDVQFVVARVVCILLIVLNGVMVLFSTYGLLKEKQSL